MFDFIPIYRLFFSFPDSTSRLKRYENLYKTHKCTFPPTNSIPPLFGKDSYLSRCDSVGDPVNKTKSYSLSASLCQSLLDELLIVCRGTRTGTNATSLLNHVKSLSATQLCQDPVIKENHPDNDWKLLNELTICPSMCSGKNLWICRIRVFLWKYTNAPSVGKYTDLYLCRTDFIRGTGFIQYF